MTGRGLLSWWKALRAWAGARAERGRRAFIASAFMLTLAVGGALGYVAAKTGALWQVRNAAAHLFARVSPPPRTAGIEWSIQSTEFHELAVARLPIGQAFQLAQADNHIVFAAQQGELGYLTGARVTGLGLSAPLGLAEFQQSRFARFDTIDSNNIRVTDLLTIETAAHEFDLYVAHLRYRDECFRLAVDQTHLSVTPDGITADPDWAPVFETRDCIGLRATGFPYIGPSSGGRLVRLGPDTIALSSGDFEFVGADLDTAVSADPNSDLGKITLINLTTHQARHYAQGLRNPQGLLLARDGVLWETEHGPQGGDELNIIRQGADYGWPRVTYGVPYGGNMAPSWPAGARQGAHQGYEPPRFVFTPAIGISNLIEPDTHEFPRWEHTLLVASLRGQALHLLRLEGDRVMFDEPIPFPGHRIRDIISLADGRIAFSTDDGAIYLVANAETQRPRALQLVGLNTLAAPPQMAFAGDYHSAHFFATQCAQCHSLTDEVRAGPPLGDIVGRQIGAYPGYAYSAALSGQNGRWTKERLREFLRDPQRAYPGTRMPAPASPELAHEIVDYLATHRETAAPAPPRRTASQ